METQARERQEGRRVENSAPFSLHHVAIVVSNTERASKFYRDVFGFPEIERANAGMTANHGAWFQVGATELHLQERAGEAKKSDQHFAVIASDIESIAKRASEMGGRSQESKPLEGYSKRYFVYDIDGNRIELIQR